MCGILGLIGGFSKNDIMRFSASLDLLSHRGPDARGIWQSQEILLGHRRLSIIDLLKTGLQPMHDPDSGSVIVFNGEIYNYVELAQELKERGHHLRGNSDTEVLLHSLIEWGPSVISRLNGMWAFAYWNPQTRNLLLSRDRFGVKPLYFHCTYNSLSFASEPKALISLFPKLRNVDENTMLDFLGNNLLYASRSSFYKGIDIFPAAHYGLYNLDSGVLKFTRYWDYPTDIRTGFSEHDVVEEFSELFIDAVRLRLRSDVKVGVTLSGGLDSTAVLTAAASISGAQITSFTSTYDDCSIDERGWASVAAKAAGGSLVQVSSNQEGWIETMRKISWHMDAPGYSPAVYPLWNLMREARASDVPVLLEGQGADEALAGYPQYGVIDFIGYIGRESSQSISWTGVRNRFNGLIKTFGLQATLAWIARELSPAALQWHRKRVGFQSLMLPGVRIPELPTIVRDGPDSVIARLHWDHSVGILPGLLHYGDAISMAHSIESRNPFLDYRLVEWMFRLPAHLRFNKGETKWPLREYLRENGQKTIGNRTDKKGYPTPVGKWLAAGGGSEIESILLAKDNPILRWCDNKKIKELIRKNQNGHLASEHHLYKLLSTQLWLQECT